MVDIPTEKIRLLDFLLFCCRCGCRCRRSGATDWGSLHASGVLCWDWFLYCWCCGSLVGLILLFIGTGWLRTCRRLRGAYILFCLDQGMENLVSKCYPFLSLVALPKMHN